MAFVTDHTVYEYFYYVTLPRSGQHIDMGLTETHRMADRVVRAQDAGCHITFVPLNTTKH